MALCHNLVSLRCADAFVKILVAHYHRRAAATGETFHELDRELAVLRRLQTVRVRVETELRAKMFVELVRAAERAAQRATDLDLIFPGRLQPKHRIKRQQFVNVDRRQSQFARNPFDGLL